MTNIEVNVSTNPNNRLRNKRKRYRVLLTQNTKRK